MILGQFIRNQNIWKLISQRNNMPSDPFSSFANITNILELCFFPPRYVKIHDIPIGHAVFT